MERPRPDTQHPRWAPITAVYEDVAPELARLAPLTPDRPDYDPAVELAASRMFAAIEQHTFPFAIDYTTEAFLALIDTYASHRHLDPVRRRRLHQRLSAVIRSDLGGTVTKPYEALLLLGAADAA